MELTRLHSHLVQGLEVCFAQVVGMFLEDCNQTVSGADLDRFIRFAQTCQSFSQKFLLECIL